MKRIDLITLFILIAALTIIKGTFIVFALDQFVDYRETYQAMIAKHVIEGPILPLFDYTYEETAGGTLAMGILAVPFFLVFGESLVSLKLLSLSVSVITLVLLYLIVISVFSRWTAAVVGILFILPPLSFAKTSLVIGGIHVESLPFSLLFLLLFYRTFYLKRGGLISWAAMGLTSGLGIYFSYVFPVTLLPCLFLWFIFDKKLFVRREFLIFSSSLLVGLIPWLAYNLTHSFQALYPYGLFFVYHFLSPLSHVVERLPHLLVSDMRGFLSPSDTHTLASDVVSLLYVVLFLASLVLLLWFSRRAIPPLARGLLPWKNANPEETSREIPLLLVCAAFFLLTSLGDFNIAGTDLDYEPLTTLYVWIIVIIAVALDRVRARVRGVAAVLATLLLAIPLSSGLLSAAKILGDSGGSRYAWLDYSSPYRALGMTVGEVYGKDIVRILENMDRLTAQEKRYIFEGLGRYICFHYGEDLLECDQLIQHVEKPYQVSLYERLGKGKGWDFDDDMEWNLRRISEVQPEYQLFLYERLGMWLGDKFEDSVSDSVAVIEEIDPRHRGYVYRGLGNVLASRFGDDIEEWLEKLELVEEEYRPVLYERMGREMGRQCGPGMEACEERIRKVEEKFHPDIYEGLGFMLGFRFGADPGRCFALLNLVGGDFRPILYLNAAKGIKWRFGVQEKRLEQLISEAPQTYRSYLKEGFATSLEEIVKS